MPTPLDFPNSPTVGQQYAGSNGVLYAWDGAVWTAGAATTGLPPTGAAGGDLAGTYPNPTIGPGAVGNAEISDVAYSKVTGAPSIPTTLPPSGAASGDLTGTYPGPTIGALKVTDAKVNDVAWGKITGAPTALPPSGTAGGDLSGTYPNPQILAGTIVDADVSATAAIQYTKLTGTPTTLPGPPTGAASGSLAGTYPGPTLTTTGVTAGTYGTTAKIPQVTLTAEGRVSAVTELTVAPTGGSPSGTAGGSLAGTYPNPTVAASAIRGTPSSGGTAREIAKASIWGGDDLIDVSIPAAKIAAGAVDYSKRTERTHGARVWRAAALSVASGGNVTVTFDTVDLNDAAAGGLVLWSAGAPDRLTVQSSGVYLLVGSFGFNTATAGTRRDLWIDCGFIAGRVTVPPGNTPIQMTVSAIAVLNAAAVISLLVYQDSGAAITALASFGALPSLTAMRLG